MSSRELLVGEGPDVQQPKAGAHADSHDNGTVPRRRGWLVRRALAGADVIGLLTAFLSAQWLYGDHQLGFPDRISGSAEIALFVVTLPGWILLAKLYGLYEGDEERADHSTVDDVARVFNMLTAGTWIFFAATWSMDFANPQVHKLVSFWLAGVVLVPAARAGARSLCRRSTTYEQRTIVVGAGIVGQCVARKILQHPEYGVSVIGFVDDEPRERETGLRDLTILGGLADVRSIVRANGVERVIVAFSRDPHEEIVGLVRSLDDLDVQIDVVPRLFEVIGPHVHVHGAEGLPLLGLPPTRLSRSSLFLKRAMDVFLAATGLVVISPVLLAIATAISIDSGGPILFRQIRMGQSGRTFTILKFRTMTADADKRKHEVAHLNKHLAGDPRMFKVARDPRITRVGGFLRRYSLDELPQLVNVLRGEMSLVGPRPLILEEDRHVDNWARKRLNLKPGITGVWQVLGGSDIPFAEMVNLDYLYVSTWSLWRDVRLIFGTLPVMLRGSSETC
jgi:exopolysaccharide biosynthesis polyprenyl glycosylphosphotransferase